MGTRFFKPSSKESDTDEKENLEKEGKLTVNRLDRSTDTGEKENLKKEGKITHNRSDQTTAYTLKKGYVGHSASEHRGYSEPEASISNHNVRYFEGMRIRKVYVIPRLRRLLATTTIPDFSEDLAIREISVPRPMPREKRSTYDSAAGKQGLIAVQDLPFGMIRNIVYHYLYQKNRVIAGKLLMHMSVFIKASCYEYIDVWPAYQEAAEWNPVFVVLCRTNFQGEWDEYSGFKIFKRHYDFVSSEAAQIFNSQSVQETPIELNGFLTNYIYATDLINTHSNITIVNVCPVRSKNGGRDLTEETCIVIHCRVKGFIPFTEKPFPKTISTLPVDVREGYCVLGMQTPEPQSDATPLRNTSDTNSGASSNNNTVGLNGHSAAFMNSSTSVPGNGTQANGDIEIADDPRSLHEMTMDDMCKQFQKLSIAYRELLKGKDPNDFNESLLMGTSISQDGNTSTGTLGGFVCLPGGKVGFLTCAHVVGTTPGVQVSQPSDGVIDEEFRTRQRTCGYVSKSVFTPGSCDVAGVDAAVVVVTDRHPLDGEFIKLSREKLSHAGYGPKKPLQFSKGKIMSFDEVIANRRSDLIKVGSETGLTRGLLYLTDTFVRVSNLNMVLPGGDVVEFYNQIEVQSLAGSTVFFDLGDSGALVFMPLKDDELHCMGLAIGRTSYFSCLVTPIERVLEELQLDPKGFIDFSSVNPFQRRSR